LLVVALVAALAPATPVASAPFQILAGPAFEAFAADTDARCPSAHVRFIKPADLDLEQQSFEASLRRSERARFKAAIPRTAVGAPKACEGRNGLSCTAINNLEALKTAHQIKRFIAFSCNFKLQPY
jgi:hypothetical protein